MLMAKFISFETSDLEKSDFFVFLLLGKLSPSSNLFALLAEPESFGGFPHGLGVSLTCYSYHDLTLTLISLLAEAPETKNNHH